MPHVAYHRESGRQEFAYAIDAHSAVTAHPKEWSWEPWGDADKQDPEIVRNAQVEIPDSWRDLSTAKRRALAQHLGAPPTVKAGEADEVIEKEVARREQVQNDIAEREEAQAQAERDNKRAKQAEAEQPKPKQIEAPKKDGKPD